MSSSALQGSVSYSSDEDEDPRRRDPFETTRDHLAQAAQAGQRPRGELAARAKAFWAALRAEDGVIDESVVRAYLFDYGCPEQPSGCRGLLWKLLLGYLPWDRRQWRESLRTQRATYEAFVAELTANPFADLSAHGDPLTHSPEPAAPSALPSSPVSSSSSKNTLRFSKISPMDDPLSTPSVGESQWTRYYKDNTIREEIDKDVRRTYSSFHFFNERVRPVESSATAVRASDAMERARAAAELAAARGGAGTNLFGEYNLRAVQHAKDTGIPSIPKVEFASATRLASDETHHDVIKRILFIYAKLNPGIRYVQGMNELLAPLYYVFAHNGADLRVFEEGTGEEDTSDVLAREGVSSLFGAGTAEPDAFFCFTAVMSHLKDRFVKSLDLSPTGVLATIANLNSLLRRSDHQLWAHLQTIAVDPRFYSFRWLTLMLSQEFELPDVLRLWDSLFAAEPEATRESTDDLAAAEAHARQKALAAGASDGSLEASLKAKLIVEFLNDVCCAMLVTLRAPLLAADFSAALKLLQAAGAGIDIQRLLYKAQDIRRMRRAGGGFVQVAPSKQPAPLPVAQLSSNFSTPQPRPGEALPKRPVHVPLLNALAAPALPSPSTAHAASPAPLHQTMSPSPPLDEIPSSLPSPSIGGGASLASVLTGAGEKSVSLLADGVAALVASGREVATPLVTAAKEAGKQALERAATTAAHSLQPSTRGEEAPVELAHEAAAASSTDA